MEENKKPENPKAFPMSSYALERGIDQHQGMTLRDYFAAKVMQSILSGGITVENNTYWDQAFEEVSIQSYKIADAMLKQRDK